MVERWMEATGLYRQSAKVDQGPGSQGEGRERRNQHSLGSARGNVCTGRQGLISSIDEAATATDGVVDERAGCCATQCQMI
jgi:hypothetical protein